MPENVTIQVPVSLIVAIQNLTAEISRLAGNSERNNDVCLEKTDVGDQTGKDEPPHNADEVLQFCRMNKITIDANKFYAYYQARGWKTKNGFRFDWKEKVKEWQAFERPRPAGTVGNYPVDSSENYIQYAQKDDLDLIAKLISRGENC